MRPLRLYLRSRRVPVALATTVTTVAGLAWLNRVTDHTPALPLLAVLVGAALTGPGLAGDDIELDRTAAWRWPLWRTVHIGAAGVAVVAVVTAPAVVGAPVAPLGQVLRDAVGLVGLVALTAATLGAQHAWIPPVTWSLLALTVLPRLWPPGEPTLSERVLTWMVQPAGPAPTTTAVTLGVVGAIAYAARGPRR